MKRTLGIAATRCVQLSPDEFPMMCLRSLVLPCDRNAWRVRCLVLAKHEKRLTLGRSHVQPGLGRRCHRAHRLRDAQMDVSAILARRRAGLQSKRCGMRSLPTAGYGIATTRGHGAPRPQPPPNNVFGCGCSGRTTTGEFHTYSVGTVWPSIRDGGLRSRLHSGSAYCSVSCPSLAELRVCPCG